MKQVTARRRLYFLSNSGLRARRRRDSGIAHPKDQESHLLAPLAFGNTEILLPQALEILYLPQAPESLYLPYVPETHVPWVAADALRLDPLVRAGTLCHTQGPLVQIWTEMHMQPP
jgi:hypothetical protein